MHIVSHIPEEDREGSHWDVDEFDKVSNKAHYREPYRDCLADLHKLCSISLSVASFKAAEAPHLFGKVLCTV